MSQTPAAILIEPGHPAESLDVALESLAEALGKSIPEAQFRLVAREHVGRGLRIVGGSPHLPSH